MLLQTVEVSLWYLFIFCLKGKSGGCKTRTNRQQERLTCKVISIKDQRRIYTSIGIKRCFSYVRHRCGSGNRMRGEGQGARGGLLKTPSKLKIKKNTPLIIRWILDTSEYDYIGTPYSLIDPPFPSPTWHCPWIPARLINGNGGAARRTSDGVRRVSGLRREPAVSVKDLTHINISHWKIDSDPLVRILCGLRTIWRNK